MAWRANRVLVEETGVGIALIQELQGSVPIIAVKPDKDKISRLASASSKMEAGQVVFPKTAHWLPDLEAELFSFP